MAGSEQHSQIDESAVGPLIHSFSELGQLGAADSTELGSEEIRSLVEDVLSDYADCDVYVQDEGEPETFTLRIGVWGSGIEYPITKTEVYEMLDAILELVHRDDDDPAFPDDGH